MYTKIRTYFEVPLTFADVSLLRDTLKAAR